MNKPATKEPSMDEILSSIRQIIADDDASDVTGPSAASAMAAAFAPVRPAPVSAAPAPRVEEPASLPTFELPDEDIGEAGEALSLTAEQIVTDEEDQTHEFDLSLDDDEEGASPDVSGLVDPDDIAFEPEPAMPEPEPQPEPAYVSRSPVERVSPPRAQRAAPAAELPDPTLTSDMAEQLLEPATKAAVRNSMARLNNLGIGTHGVTLEDMTRELLRPMLKEWLDEHLPSVVERMVEKEIVRISRGSE